MTERKTPTGGIESIGRLKDEPDSKRIDGGISKPLAGKEDAPKLIGGEFINVSRSLKDLLRTLHARIDVPAMLAFRLPGINRIVRDLRHEIREAVGKISEHRKPDGKPAAADMKEAAELEIKGGRAKEVREKKYENFLGARGLPFSPKNTEGQKPERELSKIEKLIIECFEEGKEIEKAIQEGRISFLAKTEEQWRAFFAKFLDRTAKKSADLAEIREFLYRGVVKKGDAKAVVISDMIRADGKMEKFVRFGVLYNKIGDLLFRLLPGDILAKKMVADGLASEKLHYLALLPPSIEQEILTGLKPKQGIFAAESTEARVAEDLGFTAMDKGAPDTSLQGRDGPRKKRKRLGGNEELPDDGQGRFMPWWQWGNLGKPGGLKVKRAFYSGLFIIFILTILFLIHQYLLGK